MYIPPTHFFGNKFFLKEDLAPCDEYLVLARLVEVVSPCFLGIHYKGASFGFWFELSRNQTFHISLATPNHKERQYGFLPVPFLKWRPFHCLYRSPIQNECGRLQS